VTGGASKAAEMPLPGRLVAVTDGGEGGIRDVFARV